MPDPGPLLALTHEQKRHFDDKGYLAIRGLYGEEEMAEMRREFHDLITRVEDRPKAMSYDFMDPAPGYPPDPYNPRNVRGIMDQPLASDYWFDQITDPRIVKVFVDLFGPDIDFHNGKVRNNPPGFHNRQGWHQDWPYERHSRSDLAAAILYLDDTDVDAGATWVIPGSHRRGEWETRDGHTLSEAQVEGMEKVPMIARPGDVLFIHVLVVHTAGHNRTPRSRHKVINEYKTKEAVDRWGNRCAFAGLPLARGGRLLIPRIR
jgi:ectoine hydroxylase-related dioxygenase (phytanoyl-CoA dioxygenase family)